MGVILDSSAIIAGERKRRSAAEVLSDLRLATGSESAALSVVSVVELEHGIWRARNSDVRRAREQFMSDLFQALPIHSLTFDIARLAARIDAESKIRGIAIPFQDLIIGVTALHFNYAVATLNVDHFKLIPGLAITEL